MKTTVSTRTTIATALLVYGMTSIGTHARADVPPPSGANPLVALMDEVHVLSPQNARLGGDVTGDGLQERIRTNAAGDALLIGSSRGQTIARVEFADPVGVHTLYDADGDGTFEILVRTEGKRLRAFDHEGAERVDLDDVLARLVRQFDRQAIADALNRLWRRPPTSSDTELPFGTRPSSAPGEDEEACDVAGGNWIEWDGTLHENGRRLIEGTPEDDVIVGTSGDDLIIGHAGNDIVCGRSGDDWIYGDAFEFDGAPTAGESFGNDTLFGGPGDDIVHGGPGPDFIYAGHGHDSLFGGHAADSLFGDGGGYYALPEDYFGEDFLVGMWDDDVVVGGAGSDVVNATAFDDVDTEFGFEMGVDPPQGSDVCYAHLNEIFAAAAGGCESAVISTW